MTATAPVLNALYPDYLIDIASCAMHAQDPRGAAWLARRLSGEGVVAGERMALMPFPFPQTFGMLGRAPVLSDHWKFAEAVAGTDWAADLETRAARSMAMLQAASRADEGIVAEELAPPAETNLVIDWLNALPETDPRMLDKLPRVTWAQAVQHTLAYHRRLANRALRIAGDDGAVDPLPTVDGHRWLHLVTREALDRESGAMGHCVGDGGYDHLTWKADKAGAPVRPRNKAEALMGLWSLRDPEGRSVLTVEVGMGCIEQCKRRFNDEPVPADVPHVAVLIARLSTAMPDLGLPYWLVTDARDGSLHHLHEMPDGIHLADGRYLDPDDWTRIPAGMRVDGGTILANHGAEPITFQGLHVAGKLAVHGMIRFDAGLIVEGDLDLSNAEDKAVPEGARITGKVVTERESSGLFGDDSPWSMISMGEALFRPVRGRHPVPQIRMRQVDLGLGGIAWIAADPRLPERRETLTLGVDLGMDRPPRIETMTRQLPPSSGMPLVEFTRVMEAVGDRQEAYELLMQMQVLDVTQGVLTDCYGEPASHRMPERTGETSVTHIIPAQLPAAVPRHLRDAPHYRRIEHRGRRRPMA